MLEQEVLAIIFVFTNVRTVASFVYNDLVFKPKITAPQSVSTGSEIQINIDFGRNLTGDGVIVAVMRDKRVKDAISAKKFEKVCIERDCSNSVTK